MSDEEAFKLTSSIPIIHVYGRLGRFHYAGDQGDHRVYSGDLSTKSLRIAAAGIRLIPEERDEGSQFPLARKWLDWAERICFLGFGFDSRNCGNLGLDSVLDWKVEHKKQLPVVYGSCLGLTGAEIEQARKLACGNHPWSYQREDNVMTLRELGVLT